MDTVYVTSVVDYAREIGLSETVITNSVRPLALEVFYLHTGGALPGLVPITEAVAYSEKLQKLLALLNSDLLKPFVTRNIRSDIADDIQKYWVGKKESNIGVQYLSFKDGIVHARRCILERSDIMVVQFSSVANVFVEADGSQSINEWGDAKMTPQRRSQIRSIVDAHFIEAKEYVAHEARFLKEKPWLKVDGMTPEQAVAKLTELGWGLRAKVDEDSDD